MNGPSGGCGNPNCFCKLLETGGLVLIGVGLLVPRPRPKPILDLATPRKGTTPLCADCGRPLVVNTFLEYMECPVHGLRKAGSVTW